MVHCVNAADGKPVWQHKTGGEMWSSPMVADGKIYIGTRKGDFWILAAGRNLKVLAQGDLGAPISATAAAANGTIYISTMKEIWAIGK
jgi:outer membrane protein assembly factor BamB